MEKPPNQNMNIEEAFPPDLHDKIMHKIYRAHLKRQLKILAVHISGMAVFGGIITILIYLKQNLSTSLIEYLLYGSIIAATLYIAYFTYYWGIGVVRKFMNKQFEPMKQLED